MSRRRRWSVVFTSDGGLLPRCSRQCREYAFKRHASGRLEYHHLVASQASSEAFAKRQRVGGGHETIPKTARVLFERGDEVADGAQKVGVELDERVGDLTV